MPRKYLFGAAAAFAAIAPAAAQDPFLGEIKFGAWNFVPRGFAPCDGQLLPISANTALFSLLGTQYGGDGRTTFALPDARGRVLVHRGIGPGLEPRFQGEKFGADNVTLTAANMPAHTHGANSTATLRATTANGNSNVPTGKLLADDGRDNIYAGGTADVAMSSQAVAVDTTVDPAGSGFAFSVRDPSVTVQCVIALQGIFPSRS